MEDRFGSHDGSAAGRGEGRAPGERVPRRSGSLSLKRITLALAAGFSLFALPGAALGQGWYDPDWGYRKRITIDNTMVAGDLTNFPVLLDFTDTDLRDKARNDGWDILFTADNGTTKLDHDFEDYDGATGAIVVWVEVTNLSGSADTDIYMYYGYATVPSNQENETGTWGNNYEAVYHLHNNSFADATGNHDATNSGSAGTTGIAGDGRNFVRSEDDYIDTGWNPSLTGDFTFEGWFRALGQSGSGDVWGVEDRGGGDNSEIRLAIRDTDSNNSADGYNLEIKADAAGDISDEGALPGDPDDGNWHHIALVREGSTGRLYYDGNYITLNDSVTTSGTAGFPVSLLMGAQWDTDGGGPPAVRNSLNGDLDETRVSTVLRTEDYFATQVANVNNSAPGGFYDFLSGEEVTGLIGHWNFNEGSGQVAADASPSNNDGTLGPTAAVESGDPTWACGGTALEFDGSDDEVKLSSVAIGDRAAWSISAWIKMGPDAADKRTIYGEGDTTQREYLYLDVAEADSVITFYSEDFPGTVYTQLDGTTNVEDDAWHLVTVVQRSKTDRVLYVDASPEDSSTQDAGTLVFNTASVGYLRTEGWVADPFLGTIDDVRIYDYALSPAEIATLYANPPGACGAAAGDVVMMLVSDAVTREPVDDSLAAYLQAQGLTVVFADDNLTGPQIEDSINAYNVDVMYVSQTCASSAVDDTYLTNLSIGIVMPNVGNWDGFELANHDGESTGPTVGYVADNSHYITQPFSTGDLTVYSSATPLGYGDMGFGSGADVLMHVPGDPTTGLIVAYEAGAILETGNPADGRRVGLFTEGEDWAYFTADTKTLIYRSILWGGGLSGSGSSNAVTSAVAEIAPNDVITSSTGNEYIYDIAVTIGGTDTGVDSVEITVPATHGDPTVDSVRVGGTAVTYTDNTAGKLISITLDTKVTSTDTIQVFFAADAPSSADGGVDFLSTVDDSSTPEAPQSTTEGDADGDAPDNNSWTVTTGAPYTVNYRSIGMNGAVLYQTGTASITANTSTVTFSGATLPTDIGVGDELVIGSTTFFILSRNSATEATVQETAVSTLTDESYTISRAYNTLQSWEDPCGASPCLPTSSGGRGGDLVADNRREVGVAYNDAPFTMIVIIEGNVVDATHYFTLTVAEGQRHNGTAGSGVVIDPNHLAGGFRASNDYTVFEWFELTRTGGADGRAAANVQNASNVILSNLLIHDYVTGFASYGIKGSDNSDFTVRNCIVYHGQSSGIRLNQATAVATVENCSVYGITGSGISEDAGTLTVTNSISMGNTGSDFVGGTQSYNLSDDGSASGTGSIPNGDPSTQFVNVAVGDTANWNLHLMAGSDAINAGTPLGFSYDIDNETRPGGAGWDMGADESDGVPASPAVASATAEISPNDVTTNSTGNEFVYAILPVIGGGTGVDSIEITVPNSFGDPTVDSVRVDGTAVTYTDHTAAKLISITLDTKVTADDSIQVYFAADAPTSADPTGQDFTSTVDDSGTGAAAQGTTEGDADGDASDNNSWTVTTTDSGSSGGGSGICPAVDTWTADTTITNSLTIQHTTAGPDRLMLVGVSINNNNPPDTVISITYNGIPLSREGTIQNADDARVEIWSLLNPPTGTYNAVITFGADLLESAVAGVVTLTGVDQTVPLGAFAGDQADGIVASAIIASEDGDLVFGVMSGETVTSVTTDPPADELWNIVVLTGADEYGAAATTDGSAPDDTISWTLGSSDHWAAGGIAVKPSAACLNAAPSISSAANQTFQVGDPTTVASTVTIAEHASYQTITDTDDLRVRIPAGLDMIWDTLQTTIDVGGNAAGNVSTTVSYEDAGKTAVIDVTTSFAALDTITVDSLKFMDFGSVSAADSLELEVKNDGLVSAVDDKTKEIATGAVASATAEISPNDVTTNSTGNEFIYAILPVIGGGTGVDSIEITVPNSFGDPTVDSVRVDGIAVTYTDNTSGKLIAITLDTKVTADDSIQVYFAADAPTAPDAIGQDFTSEVDDSGTGAAAQATTEGDADGDAGDSNSWTVTTTDSGSSGGGSGTCPAVDTWTADTTLTSSLTIQHTTAGVDRLMLVGVSINPWSSPDTVISITYNGAPLSRAGVVNHEGSGGNDARVEIWSLLDPPTGTYNAVITFGADLTESAVAGVVTLTGVDQTVPLGAFAGDWADGFLASAIIASEDGDLVFGVMSGETVTSVTTDPPADELWNMVVLTGWGEFGAAATTDGSAPDDTISWTLGASDHWAAGGIAVKPSAACLNAAPSISSAANQTFQVGDPTTAAEQITITEDASFGTITDANDLRIRIPAGLDMIWDTLQATIVVGGNAAGNVSTTVSYEDAGKTAVIDVTTSFAALDTITVDSLKFMDFGSVSAADSLELEVKNDGLVSAVDDKTKEITAGSGATLLGRYWFNEAPSGQVPTTVYDDQPSPVNLTTIVYDTPVEWTVSDGHRGLSGASDPHAGIAYGTASGTKYTTNLDGALEATFVAVAEWAPAAGSQRIAGFVRSGGARVVELVPASVGGLSIRIMTQAQSITARWASVPSDSTRRVFHIVYDADNPVDSLRIRLYVDGSLMPPPTLDSGTWPDPTDGLDFSAADILLTAVNNTPGDATNPLNGTCFYYAVYAGMLTDGEISTNTTALLADDDSYTPTVSVTPDGLGSPVLREAGTDYSQSFAVTNNSTLIDDFDLLTSVGPAPSFLTVDSITGTNVTQGADPDSARLTGVASGATDSVTVWYTVASSTDGRVDTLYIQARSITDTTKTDNGYAEVEFDLTVTGTPLVRYWIDEAPSGQGVANLIDSESNPINMPLTYVDSVPYFAGDNGGYRHLRFNGPDNTDTGGGLVDVGGTKMDAVHGSTVVTIEAKYAFESGSACTGQDERIFGISEDRGSAFGQLQVRGVSGAHTLSVMWAGVGTVYRYALTGGCNLTSASVVHWVIDTNEATDSDRVRAYVGGVRQTVTVATGAWPSGGATIDLGAVGTRKMYVGRPYSGLATMKGRIWYVALYLGEMSDAQIASNATALGSSDDDNTYAVTVTPDGATVVHQPGTEFSQAFTVTNNSSVLEDFDLLARTGPASSFITIDSITGSMSSGIPDSARVTGIAASGSEVVTVWYTVASSTDGRIDTLFLRARSTSNPAELDDGWLEVEFDQPTLTPLVRYWIDEAPSGQGVANLIDAESNPLNMPLNYPATSPYWAGDSGGNRHLRFSGAGDTGGGVVDTDGTKMDAVHGATQVTIEVKYMMDGGGTCSNNGERIFGLSDGDVSTSGWLAVRERAGRDVLQVQWQGQTVGVYALETGCPISSASVVHWVVDTTEPVAADRIRAYIDGVQATVTPVESTSLPSQNETIDLGPATRRMFVGRPNSGFRNFSGRIWYAALYVGEMSGANIASNAAALLAMDDNNTYDVTVTPDGGSVVRLAGTDYSYDFTLNNGSSVLEDFDLLASTDPASSFITIDSITGGGISDSGVADSTRIYGVDASADSTVTVWYTITADTDGNIDTLYLRGRSISDTAQSDLGWIEIEYETMAFTVAPDGADTLQLMPTGTAASSSYKFTITNNSLLSETFDLLAFDGAVLTVDSITGPNVSGGSPGDSARTGAIAASAEDSAFVWFTISVGTAGALDSLYLMGRSVGDPSATDSGWVFVELLQPDLVTAKVVNPNGTQPPGTDLTYTLTITNNGTADGVNVVTVDSLAAEVYFQVGSVVTTLPGGMTDSIEYYDGCGSDGWSYTPVSGGGGAPAGYDACAVRIRWTLLNDFSYVAPNNTADLEFVARIK